MRGRTYTFRMAGRPKEGPMVPIRLAEFDQEYAKTLSDVGELADGIRRALDRCREQDGVAVPKRPRRRRKRSPADG